MTLDDIGILNGTDKSSVRHDYLVHYERFFAQWREERFNLIEIGVYNGASLETWRDFFPNAQIVGADINPAYRRHAGTRIAIEIGSQADPDFLDSLAEQHPPLVVIDDGSHRADHQIFTFERLFPKLLPGGCYIVEDLSTGEHGESPIAAPAYFGELGQRLMSREDTRIARIEILRNAIALWKAAESNLPDPEHQEMLARQSPRAEILLFLAETLMRRGLPGHALRCIQEAVRREPRNPWFHHRMSEIFERLRDYDAALAAEEEAVRLKLHPVFADRLKRLQGLHS